MPLIVLNKHKGPVEIHASVFGSLLFYRQSAQVDSMLLVASDLQGDASAGLSNLLLCQSFTSSP